MEILNPKRNSIESQVYGMEILNPKEMVMHKKIYILHQKENT